MDAHTVSCLLTAHCQTPAGRESNDLTVWEGKAVLGPGSGRSAAQAAGELLQEGQLYSEYLVMPVASESRSVPFSAGSGVILLLDLSSNNENRNEERGTTPTLMKGFALNCSHTGMTSPAANCLTLMDSGGQRDETSHAWTIILDRPFACLELELVVAPKLHYVPSTTCWVIFLSKESPMDIFVSAVLGEVFSRSVNYFISKSSKLEVLDVEDNMHRALLRAQVIIDEATGRHITNQAMLQQLNMLRDAMYQGCYILDTFRYRSHDEKHAKDQVLSHSFFVSKVNSMEGISSSKRKTHILEQLEDTLDNLRTMIIDVKELVLFLRSYPQLHRQPYSMHLLLGKCMFGRQMEADLVLNFLLHTQPNGAEGLEILPVVGPSKVGKSTLVAHVCNDERVRDHFSEIMFLSNHDFKDEKLTYLWEGCVKKCQNSTSSGYGRMLVVVEVAGDFNEDEWKRLYAASKQCMASGSKIIVTSRSVEITKVGTTRPVTLKYLSHEEYWYFFKTLAFGSTDPMMHPKMACVAMEIARMMNGSLFNAMSLLCLLRENFDIHFWCKIATFLRRLINWHVSKFGEHLFDALVQNKPAHLGRMIRTSEEIVVLDQYECSSQEEVPKISLPRVMYGSVKPPSGRFEGLVWRSPIPPCYNYIYVCEVRDLKTTAAKRKRS